MQAGIFKIAVFFTGFMFLGLTHASAQQVQPRSQSPAGSAEGTLTVTATVVSSTGIVIGPDGQPRIIVANAADPTDLRDSASHSPEAKVESPAATNEQKTDARPPLDRIGAGCFLGADVQIDIAQAGGSRGKNNGPCGFLASVFN